jgi:hypothetical protein
MKRLICVGCGVGEDLDNPTGDIHTIQVTDSTSPYCETGGPDTPIQEDLCSRCRTRLRQEFFGESEAELLDMPLMASG